MLATKHAQGPSARNFMASSSVHAHAHMTVVPTSYAPNFSSSQLHKYSAGSSKPNMNGAQQGWSPPSSNAAPQIDGNNIMNRKADLNSSLYQICLELRRRLSEVPGFEQHIVEMEDEEAEADDSTDPVTSMWNCLRRGYPLMTIYNALQPQVPLEVDPSKVAESKIGKAATFKFLQACLTDLRFPANECFLITDLYGGDTTGFVKVTKVVNRVLYLLSQRGMLLRTEPGPGNGRDNEEPRTRTHRQHVVEELVKTERTYVQHLETLQHFKNQIEQTGAIPGDAVHDIFLNLNALLDFQRRFLIRIEQQNTLPESQQNWGRLFIQYKDSFRVYEPFIANQSRCNTTVEKEWDKLKAAEVSLSPEVRDMVASSNVLNAFLLKPFQRLTKYPILLVELRKKGDLDEERQRDLSEGWAAANSVLIRANDAVDKEQRQQALGELQSRVEDWKGHKIEHFGDLLLYGDFTVLKGDGVREVEREYKVYLFERILLCCKEINPNKQKNKMLGNNKSLIDKKGKPRLQLKGRIFMQNVTDVMSISKAGSYSIQIFWRGDPGVENFVVKFSSEEVMNRWRSQVEAQKKVLSDSARRSSHAGTSETEFTYMRGQGAILQNPYQQEEDADDDFEEAGAQAAAAMGAPLEFTMNPNASSTSLRSRSTTGGSGPPTSQHQGRAPPPRFPVLENGHGPSLTLHTNVPPSMSPAELAAASSYFSPTVESPVSTRSSSQASMYPFPRQGTPGNGWVSDESKHNTAPAAVRAPSRDGQASPNCFVINGRTVQRPSLPAIASHISQNAQQLQLNMAQSRMRSASSPDMQQIIPGTRRYANGQIQCTSETIPVPPIPPHMAQMRAPLNRSQSNSPTNAQLPFRSATQSPNLQRDGAPRYAGQHVHDGPPQLQAIRHEARPYLPTTQTSPAPFFSPEHRLMSPPLPTATLSDEVPYPSQLKVKIWFSPHPSHVTIVVPIIIKHRSLIDRIDSKMEKISRASISRGTARLRYKDADGDSVLIGSDEDVQLAIEDWGLAHREELRAGNIADFELVWQET
ncbi:MAG: Rho guanyl nucleotide exchange [Lasallia pustulata]|uniref:Rho guanyl nucleotide exchange n=1 Tax=Lasallia pustulata TaxID=136370 RepID=A0A5M8PPT1_9LECA|nr:MAG: Rho guanyl nucleotide exchange [Lasallia pustulata]